MNLFVMAIFGLSAAITFVFAMLARLHLRDAGLDRGAPDQNFKAVPFEGGPYPRVRLHASASGSRVLLD